MKRSLILLMAVLFVGAAFGQEKNELKGPKAKNFKYFKQTPKSTFVMMTTDAPSIKGPKAKNNPLAGTQSAESTIVVTRRFYRGLKGPRAKNLRPGKI